MCCVCDSTQHGILLWRTVPRSGAEINHHSVVPCGPSCTENECGLFQNWYGKHIADIHAVGLWTWIERTQDMPKVRNLEVEGVLKTGGVVMRNKHQYVYSSEARFLIHTKLHRACVKQRKIACSYA